MQQSWLYKWLLPIIGTILLGAIGSGVWDAVFKPGLSWVTNALLDVATLGISSLRDAIYIEIAKGTYERASLRVEVIIYGTIVFIGAVTIIRVVMTALREKRTGKNNKKLTRTPSMPILWIACLLLGVSTGYFQLAIIRDIYIVRAANNIEQFQKIVATAISAEERVSFASRVAQIRSKQDYEKIIDELSIIAKKHDLRIPEFDIY